jgi:uncharacterized phage protein (TIGR02216 family)
MDWAGLMRLGLGELRLRPDDFWALTPAELRLIAGREGQGAPMTRAGFEGLARAYPDERGGSDDR